MQKSQFLILVIFGFFTACSTQKIVVPELLITDTDKFDKLDNCSLYITTKDSVLYKLKSESSEKILIKKKILKGWRIMNYKFSKDSLFVEDVNFETCMSVSTIDTVKCKGVWDDEVGFISEEEILDYNKGGFKAIGGAILGVLGGVYIGGATGAHIGIASGSNTNDRIGRGLNGLGIGALIGIISGGVLGYNIFTPNYNLETIIEKVRASRKKL